MDEKKITNAESEVEIETQAIQVDYPVEGVARVTIASQPLGVLRFGVKRA